MGKNTIGIDISDFSIEAVAIEKTRGHFDIEAYSRFRLSPEIVEDGHILDKTRLKDDIVKMLRGAKPHSMEGYKKVALSLPESKIYSKVFSLPKNLKDKDLIKAAANKAEELFPENKGNLVSASKILKTNGDFKEVFYTAAELDIVYDFIKVFNELGMEVGLITSEAVSSFAGLDDKFKKTTTLLLDIGSRTTIASIFDSNGIKSSINIDIAGNDLTNAIAHKLGISHSAAEDKKREIGMTSDGNGEVMLIIQGQFQPLADELKRFVSHFEDSNNQKVSQIVLVGGVAQMKGVDQYFGQNLNMPAYIGQPFAHSNLFNQGLSPSKYINAIGLARLSHEKVEIDFYSNLSKEQDIETKEGGEENKTQKDKTQPKDKFSINFNFKKFWWLLLILLLIILGALFYFFKDSILGSLDKPTNQTNTTIENGNQPQPEPVVEKMSKHIFVSPVLKEGANNFISGQYFDLDFDYEIPTSQDYQTSMDDLEMQASDIIVTYVNNQYSRNGYYIIPQVLDYDVLSVSPSQEEFKVGDVLQAKIKFHFLMAKEEDILNILSNISQINKENIKVDNYSVFSYSLDNNADVFDLLIDFEKI